MMRFQLGKRSSPALRITGSQVLDILLDQLVLRSSLPIMRLAMVIGVVLQVYLSDQFEFKKLITSHSPGRSKTLLYHDLDDD